MVDKKYWRFPTRKSIDKLAKILDVPNTPYMQDWEWEIADSRRIREYLSLYDKSHMTDDDKFVLMETIIQAHEDVLGGSRVLPRTWRLVEERLVANINLHRYSILYWSCLSEFNPVSDSFFVTRLMRRVRSKVCF